MTIIYNRPKCYGSEWEAYVDDEATARGIDPKDWQALEALEEELDSLESYIKERNINCPFFFDWFYNLVD